jgi:hypothetical protein
MKIMKLLPIWFGRSFLVCYEQGLMPNALHKHKKAASFAILRVSYVYVAAARH